ncbi:MAG: carbohydrate ABC transporter permease [Chloroflexota bacterium]
MSKLSSGEKIFSILNNIFLVGLCLVFLIPFLSVIMTSFVGAAEYARRGAFILIPEEFDFTAYRLFFRRSSIVINAYQITLFRVFVGTSLNLLFTATLAYVLSKRNLPGRIPLTIFVFITMIFSGGLIPNFMLMDILGLLDNIWVLILPGLINPFYLLIMRNFFMGIPAELEEAAIIDGASPPIILLRIILPLSMPAIATIGLFYAVWHWNAWFDAAIYLSDLQKMPVQVILRGILDAAQSASSTGDVLSVMLEVDEMPPGQSLKAAMIMVTTLPILIVYPFIQQYFVKGALIGGIKG